jgi:tetratricopeptide (TPR) repeat protein
LKGKKLSRREMKEDAFVTFAFRALDYVKLHRSKFILGGVALVAAIAITSYVSSSRRGAEEAASRQFLAGVLQQRRANYSGAIAAYEDVVSRHSGTSSGKLALLYLGHARYELEQYEQATEAYERYLDQEKGDKLTRAHATRGIAACLENTGKYTEAAQRYLEVARNLDPEGEVPEDLMLAARCFRLAGTPERAVELLQEIVDEYPDYQEVEKVKVFLAELQYASSQ